MYLSENLIYLRNKANLTQQAQADRLGVQQTTYSSYETGVSRPNLQRLVEIAEMLGVTAGTLLDVDLSKGGKPNKVDKPYTGSDRDQDYAELQKKYIAVIEENSRLKDQLLAANERIANFIPIKNTG